MSVSWMEPHSLKGKCEKILRKGERSVFLRDYASVIHSLEFRRLSGKTQMFSRPNNDHIRSRLTHSLEAEQVARNVSRIFIKLLTEKLGKLPNGFQQDFEDVCATACLLHDLGHPPFGHTGQSILHSLVERTDSEGFLPSIEFDDNKQVFHLLASEASSISVSSVAAIASVKKIDKSCYQEDKACFEAAMNNLKLSNKRHPASYIMEMSDDIAYLCSDLEDYLMLGGRREVGFAEALKEALSGVPAVDEALNPNGFLSDKILEAQNLIAENGITTLLIRSLLAHATESLRRSIENLSNLEELPSAMHKFVIESGSRSLLEKGELNFLFTRNVFFETGDTKLLEFKNAIFKERILKLPYIAQQDSIAEVVLEKIWSQLVKISKSDYQKRAVFRILPNDLRSDIDLIESDPVSEADKQLRKKRCLCSFVSGMTDRYAIDFLARLEDPSQLRLVA